MSDTDTESTEPNPVLEQLHADLMEDLGLATDAGALPIDALGVFLSVAVAVAVHAPDARILAPDEAGALVTELYDVLCQRLLDYGEMVKH